MTSIAPGNQTVDPPRRSRALGVPRWLPRPTLIILRLLPLIPVLLVTVLLAAALTDGAVATLKQNAAGILGNAALLSLAVTFAITPVTTVTGWRWHQILARDLGLWTFALAALERCDQLGVQRRRLAQFAACLGRDYVGCRVRQDHATARHERLGTSRHQRLGDVIREEIQRFTMSTATGCLRSNRRRSAPRPARPPDTSRPHAPG